MPKKRNISAVTRMGKWKPVFIESLKTNGNVTASAYAAKVDIPTVYVHRKKDAAFAREWRMALRQASDVLEKEAWRRAVDGIKKPMTVAGQRVDVKEYSDTLLIFLLKGNRPKKFRDFIRQEITGKNGASIEIKNAFDWEAYRSLRSGVGATGRISATENSN